MKPIFWDSEEIDPWTGQKYTWDSPNPNVTWDGVLEENDPGYVPPPINPTTKQRSKTSRKMKHNSFYPTNVPMQIIWLTNFYLKLIGHYPGLGVTQLVCAAAVADCRWLIYILGSYQPAQKASAKAVTESVKQAQTGTGDTVMVLPPFEAPPLPGADAGLPAVVPVKPGALTRIFSLIQTMQELPGFTDAIALDLGTVGTEDGGPDLEIIQPDFDVRIVGNHVFLDWGWDGNGAFLDQIQLQVDRGQGWTDLVWDTTPGYTDTQPFPATPAVWKYRGIYRVGDSQVGVWSTEKGVNVGG